MFCFFGGGGVRWETLWKRAIRHILPLAEGDGRGGFVALALPHHVHTRDKKNNQRQSCNSEEHNKAPENSHHHTRPVGKSLSGTRRVKTDHFRSYFSASIKKGGYGEGGGASELEILLQTSRLFHGLFFLEGGEGKSATFSAWWFFFFGPSLSASNESFIWFYVDHCPSLFLSAVWGLLKFG